MKKVFWVLSGIAFCLCLAGIRGVFAEEASATKAELKQALRSDQKEVKEAHQEIKANSEEARAAEKQLHEQIKAAVEAGDTKKADSLREQLKTMHHEDVQEKIEDNKELKDKKQELNKDLKEARDAGVPPPPMHRKK